MALTRNLHEAFYSERREHGIFGLFFEIQTRMVFNTIRPRIFHASTALATKFHTICGRSGPFALMGDGLRRFNRHVGKGIVTAFFLLLLPNPALALSDAFIVVPDKLCLPGEEVFVEAYLYRQGVFALFRPQIQGELLEFTQPGGHPVGAFLTDPSGMARIRCKPEHPGQTVFTVRLGENSRYKASPGQGTVFARRKQRSLFFILIEGGLIEESNSPLFSRDLPDAAPSQGSKSVAQKIASTSALVFLTTRPQIRSQGVNEWLDSHGFPRAPLVCLGHTPSLERLTRGIQEVDTGPIESLRKGDRLPACLVTGNRFWAEAASEKELTVFYLHPSSEAHGAPDEESSGNRDAMTEEEGNETSEEKRRNEASVASEEKTEPYLSFPSWDEIPTECPHR